ncbi:MAG: helix-turn-helix domain-containing protein [Candidatus Micrarchaeota archaeon]|nr:helix-turn-helix domain-containing protein [Candidatus Micrarchaeota archaeon]
MGDFFISSTYELLTPEEVAQLLKVDKITIYSWIERKLITYVRINKKVVRFRYSDIEDFINKHLVKPSDVEEVVDEILSKLS